MGRKKMADEKFCYYLCNIVGPVLHIDGEAETLALGIIKEQAVREQTEMQQVNSVSKRENYKALSSQG
ncbi:hypothetical protein SUGI_0110070 [Cryptomeria japonica]|nr:hypothetical protein SUGI_0110070 [Cryptomeria japonica]